MFSKLKQQIKERFDNLSSSNQLIFRLDSDPQRLWDIYLENFPEDSRQDNNCNCCKSFVRQYGNLCFISPNGKIENLWEVEAPDGFEKSVEAMRQYLSEKSIKSVYYNSFASCGTDQNVTLDGNIWQHFYVKLPQKFIKREAQIGSLTGEYTSTVSVLQRSIETITDEALEIVIELIKQNSLYRGQEFLRLVESFRDLKAKAMKIKDSKLRENCLWLAASSYPENVCRIRNVSIGTLLIEISEGKEIDKAVEAFERMVAPTNYKRPTPVVTQKMLEEAKKTINELGYSESLERRIAISTDISIDKLLFVDRSSELGNVFDTLEKEIAVSPSKFSKVEEITIQDFIEKVLPSAKSIKVLLENNHLSNFVTLTTGSLNHPSLFKWDNHFAWSYTGGITDSIVERVKAAGGKVDGILRASLAWNNYDDLDLHYYGPEGHVHYGNKSVSGKNGNIHLDVDENAGHGITRTPVENIIWGGNTLREGEYLIKVNQFSRRESRDDGFTLQIAFGGETFEFSHPKNENKEYKFTYSKANGIVFSSGIKSTPTVKEKWGLKTCSFVKVRSVMLSPNYWEKQIGNKHFFLMLDKCKADEAPRPFFNEFLKEDLEKHRKVFELLGAKVPLSISTEASEMSGIGFSETKRAEFIVEVESAFKRHLKVKI